MDVWFVDFVPLIARANSLMSLSTRICLPDNVNLSFLFWYPLCSEQSLTIVSGQQMNAEQT